MAGFSIRMVAGFSLDINTWGDGRRDSDITLLSDFSAGYAIVIYGSTWTAQGTSEERDTIGIHRMNTDGALVQRLADNSGFGNLSTFLRMHKDDFSADNLAYANGGFYNLLGQRVVNVPMVQGIYPSLVHPMISGYAFLEFRGANGNRYYTVMNRQGDVLFEPIFISDNAFLGRTPGSNDIHAILVEVTAIQRPEGVALDSITVLRPNGVPVAEVHAVLYWTARGVTHWPVLSNGFLQISTALFDGVNLVGDSANYSVVNIFNGDVLGFPYYFPFDTSEYIAEPDETSFSVQLFDVPAFNALEPVDIVAAGAHILEQNELPAYTGQSDEVYSLVGMWEDRGGAFTFHPDGTGEGLDVDVLFTFNWQTEGGTLTLYNVHSSDFGGVESLVFRYEIHHDSELHLATNDGAWGTYERTSHETGQDTTAQVGVSADTESQTPIGEIAISFGGISLLIPSTWTYTAYDFGPTEIDIHNEDGSISLFAGYIIAGDPQVFIDENPSQPFHFSDGSAGYMVETHGGIVWVPVMGGSVSCCGISIFHDGNRAIFENNEEVILRIVRSLRVS